MTEQPTPVKNFYITFGQIHAHRVNGKTFDKDCVAIIQAATYEEARRIAWEAFNGVFAFSYSEEEWEESNMRYFPRGYICLNCGPSGGWRS